MRAYWRALALHALLSAAPTASSTLQYIGESMSPRGSGNTAIRREQFVPVPSNGCVTFCELSSNVLAAVVCPSDCWCYNSLSGEYTSFEGTYSTAVSQSYPSDTATITNWETAGELASCSAYASASASINAPPISPLSSPPQTPPSLPPPISPPSSPPHTPPSLPPPHPPVAGVVGDPHFHGAHGDTFDFKGVDGGIYVLLSTPRLSLAAAFEHYSGQTLNLHFDAKSRRLLGAQQRDPSKDGLLIKFTYGSLIVETKHWRTSATAFVHPRHRQLQMNINIQPLGAERVAPHGLLGQTYDEDEKPLHGRKDKYGTLDDGSPTKARKSEGGTVTTRALGEGAIEGVAEMYRVHQPYETDFEFSRFGKKYGRPRNVSLIKITGYVDN